MHPTMIMSETLQGSQIQADPGSDLNVIRINGFSYIYTCRSSSTELGLLLEFSNLTNRNENARFTYSLPQSQRTDSTYGGVFLR